MKAYPLGGFLNSVFAPKGVMEDCARHIRNSNALVTKRLEKGNNGRPDIFGFILRQSEEKMSRPLMNANAGMFMMSGTETAATAPTSMTCCLLNNPDKLKKVVQEIRAIPEEMFIAEGKDLGPIIIAIYYPDRTHPMISFSISFRTRIIIQIMTDLLIELCSETPSLQLRVSLKVAAQRGRLHVRKAFRVDWLVVP